MRKRTTNRILVLTLLATLIAAAWKIYTHKRLTLNDSIREALLDAQGVLSIGPNHLPQKSRLRVLPAQSDREIMRTLKSADEDSLKSLLETKGVTHILTATNAQSKARYPLSLLERFARLDGFDRFCGVILSKKHALYTLDTMRGELSAKHRDALAHVAREILSGKDAPHLASFPERLRASEKTEILIVLRRNIRPILWRSARGSSIAQALLVATEVAKDRWAERQNALGGPLVNALQTLDVEVAIIKDDGTLKSDTEDVLNELVTPKHGIGYERKGAWNYLLPEQTHFSQRSATTAFAELFAEHGMERDSWKRRDIRLYRLTVASLAVSSPRPELSD